MSERKLLIHYLRNKANVAVFGRDHAKYHGKEGKNLYRYTVDFTLHPLDLESKFREALKDFKGVLHSVIVCHGLAVPGSISTMNLKQWDQCMNINVRSVFMVVSLAIPFLKLQHSEDPSVCIITGAAGKTPYPGYTGFSVAKAMVHSLIECAALEMAYYNIRFNGVAPGITSKNFEQTSGADTKKKGTEKTLFISEKQIPLTLHPRLKHELKEHAEAKIIEGRDVADTAIWL